MGSTFDEYCERSREPVAKSPCNEERRRGGSLLGSCHRGAPRFSSRVNLTVNALTV
jgi:hypothetical protein